MQIQVQIETHLTFFTLFFNKKTRSFQQIRRAPSHGLLMFIIENKIKTKKKVK